MFLWSSLPATTSSVIQLKSKLSLNEAAIRLAVIQAIEPESRFMAAATILIPFRFSVAPDPGLQTPHLSGFLNPNRFSQSKIVSLKPKIGIRAFHKNVPVLTAVTTACDYSHKT
jgi:hypothetical protein